jgi:hypothetical protein
MLIIAGGVTQVVECFSSKHEALSSNHSAEKKKKNANNNSWSWVSSPSLNLSPSGGVTEKDLSRSNEHTTLFQVMAM